MIAGTTHNIPAVILAGGRSSRMQGQGLSGDKYLHPLDDKPIIEHLIERLRIQVNHIALNANPDQADLSKFGLPLVADRFAFNSGPLAGILTAMEYAKDKKLVLTAAADTPFIPSDLVARMMARMSAGYDDHVDVVFARSDHNIHPTFGLWRTDLALNLKHWLQQGHKPSIIHFAANLTTNTVDFPLVPLPDGTSYDPFFNINEPQDLIKARALQNHLDAI